MHVQVKSNPKNPRERAAHLDALGDSLAKINLTQIEAIDAPCCAPCAGVSLGKNVDVLKDAASLVSDGRGGPVSIVAYSMAVAMKKGKHCHMRHEVHDEGTRPVYYADGERRDPLRVYMGHACPCGKLKGKNT